MAKQVLEARIRQKTDTLANWEDNELVLLGGEQAFILNEDGIPVNFRIGDGTKTFAQLPNWIAYDQAAYSKVTGTTLPASDGQIHYTFLGAGTYTQTSGGNVVIPAGSLGIVSDNGTTWGVDSIITLPTVTAVDEYGTSKTAPISQAKATETNQKVTTLESVVPDKLDKGGYSGSAEDMDLDKSLSASEGFWSTTLSINTVTSKINISDGYYLSKSRRENVNAIPVKEIDLPPSPDYYFIWIDVVSKEFSISSWNTITRSINKFVLCAIQRTSTAVNIIKNNVNELSLNGVIQKLSTTISGLSDLGLDLGASSNDQVWIPPVTINTTTGAVSTSNGWFASKRRSTNVSLSNASFTAEFSNGSYQAIWVNLASGAFGISNYNAGSLNNKDVVVLCRVNMTSSGLKVQNSICDALVIDGVDFGNKALYDSASLIRRVSLSGNDAYWTSTLDISSVRGTAVLQAGFIISRTVNSNHTPVNNEIPISLISGMYYVFWFDMVTNTFGYSQYNSYPSVDSKDKFILCRFGMTGAHGFEMHTNNVRSLLLNNRQCGLRVKTPVSAFKYGQVGDSISYQYDGKKENLRSEFPTGTGYRTINGWGQKICQHFGITYDNHASHGLNGRTFISYMTDINTPPNSDLVFQLPKDCDFYTIELGTNDWGSNAPLGTKLDYLNNTFDYTSATRTIYGAMRRLIDYITDTSTSTKDKKIIFITPIGWGTYGTVNGGYPSTWQYNSDGEIVERVNTAGYKMSDLVNAIKWVADQIGAYVVDIYNKQGFVQKNRLNIQADRTGGVPNVYQGILYDNLHLSPRGNNEYGNYVVSEIEKIIVKSSF